MSQEGQSPAPSPKGTGPKEAAARPPLAANSSRSDRQDRAERAGRAAWAAAVARRPLDPAARLVPGQLADRATGDGRVRVAVAEVPASCCPPAAAVAEVPASCCPPAAAVADALADLASRGLLVRDGGALVLTVPAEGWL